MTCELKRRYPDQPTALAFAAHRDDRGVPYLTVYRCPDCAGWHLTRRAGPLSDDDFAKAAS